MTGGRPGRGPRIAGRRERGPQRGDTPPEETRWTGTGGAELEDLHVAAVSSRGGARVGFRTAIVGVALVGLLAVGFGAFGGRPQPSAMPVWSPAAAASGGPAPTPQIAAPETPRVTPFEPCAVDRNDAVPTVWLEVGNEAYMGAIEVLAVNPDALPIDLPGTGTPPDVSVGIGAETAVVIDGSRCALGWVLDYDAVTTIDVVANGAMDPTRAAQNRFELALADNPGRVSLLRAQLNFSGFSVRASWNVRVATEEHPRAELSWLDGDVQPAIEGCFVGFQYDNGWQEPARDCAGEPSHGTHSVHGQAEFRFFLGEWLISLGDIACGRGMDEVFVRVETGCAWTMDIADGVITVDVPPTLGSGEATLAIDACASNGPVSRAYLCGTWYAGIKVR